RVALRGEAGPAVELALEPQRHAAEAGEEVLRQGRAVRGIDCVGEELRVGLGDRTAEDAEAERVRSRTVRLYHEALTDQGFQVHLSRLEPRQIPGRVVRALSRGHHRDAGRLDDSGVVRTDRLLLDDRNPPDLVVS